MNLKIYLNDNDMEKFSKLIDSLYDPDENRKLFPEIPISVAGFSFTITRCQNTIDILLSEAAADAVRDFIGVFTRSFKKSTDTAHKEDIYSNDIDVFSGKKEGAYELIIGADGVNLKRLSAEDAHVLNNSDVTFLRRNEETGLCVFKLRKDEKIYILVGTIPYGGEIHE